MSSWIDRFGSLASATCALHCLTFTIAPAVASAVGLGALTGEAFEWGFFSVAMAMAAIAAFMAFRTHGDLRVLGGFGVGMLVLGAGRVSEMVGLHGGVVLAVAGGAVLGASHLFSIRQARLCCEQGACE